MQPTLAQRKSVCQRPSDDTVVMYQSWDKLLFLHWEVEPDLLRATLPPTLHLDTWDGKAYLGIVPFFMNRVRPRFCPLVPGISWFLEMNLRTYVHDDRGVPGVWFYSLDANQQLAVGLARRLFHLPYQHSQMKASVDAEGWVHYRSKRLWTVVQSEFLYRAKTEPMAAAIDTLEFFLAERYLLYADIKGTLHSGRVHHSPYPLCEAQVEKQDAKLFKLNGFDTPGRPADLAHYAEGVKVDIYPLRRHRHALNPLQRT